VIASRVVPVVAVILLAACAASHKRSAPEPPPPYSVGASIGLVVTPEVTPIKVRMPDDETAAGIDAAAEAKRKEAQKGAGVTAFTILVAPLAILAPLYPPAIQLAALPFMAANETANLSQQVDKLKEKAAQVRRDAACAGELAAAHPGVDEAFQQALADEALRRAIEVEVRDALFARARVPVSLVDGPRDADSTEPFPFVEEAKARALPTVVNVDIVLLNLSAEATGADGKTCRYTVAGIAEIAWWDVEKHLLVYRNDTFGRTKLPIEAFDLPELLEHPDELRLRMARGFRDAVAATFNVHELKFAGDAP
jgi:hypothetical protein